MSVHCGTCGMALPREAMEEDWPGCPNCQAIKEARRVNKAILAALERIVQLLEEKAK